MDYHAAIVNVFDIYGEVSEIHIFDTLPEADRLLRGMVQDDAHDYGDAYAITSLIDQAIPIRAAFPGIEVIDHRKEYHA